MKRWDPVAKQWVEVGPSAAPEAPGGLWGSRPFGGPAGFLGVTGQTRPSGDIAYDPAYQAMMQKFNTTMKQTGSKVERQKQAMQMADTLGKSVLNSALAAGSYQAQNALQTIQSVLADAGLRGRGQPSFVAAGGSPGTQPFQLGWGMQLPGSSDVAITGGIGAMRPLTGETTNPIFPMTSREPTAGLSSPEGNYLGGISNMSQTHLPPSTQFENRVIITRQPTEDRPGYYNMQPLGASVPASRQQSPRGMNIQGKILTPQDYMLSAAEALRPPGVNKNQKKKSLHWDPMLQKWVNS